MKQFRLFFFLSIVCASSPGWAFAASSDFVEGEVIVKFKSSVTGIVPMKLALAGATSVEVLGGQTQLIRVPKASIFDTIAKLRRDPSVEFAEPNYLAHASYTPNDPLYATKQPELTRVKANLAWDLANGAGIRVAVLDTGIESAHLDLVGKVAVQYDFVNKDSIADDQNGHGTHTAGTIAANTNNRQGVASVAFGSALVVGKVLGADGSGSYADIIAGINWAVQNKSKVISMSFGGSYGSHALKDAIDNAWNKGSVLVAAAGNGNSSMPTYPAYYTNVIAVGAVDNSDVKANFSNYGSWVDIVAPGVNISSTYLNQSYATLSGTSMATPLVSGAAAVAWSYFGASTSNVAIRSRITTKTDSVNFGLLPKPRLNVYKALTGP